MKNSEFRKIKDIHPTFAGNGENLYFMSELAADGRYLLCCRPDSERIRHMLCKDAPEDDSTEFDMVADLYGELVIKDGLKQLESVCAS